MMIGKCPFIFPFLFIFTVCRGSSLTYHVPACLTNNTACSDGEYIQAIADVISIEECQQLCLDDFECQTITYYGSNSFPYSEICFMFRECPNLRPCESCVTSWPSLCDK